MKNVITILALILVVVGALNWFMIGFFSFNLVEYLFGASTMVTKIVYGAVGIAGIWLILAAIFMGLKGKDGKVQTKKA